MEPDRVVYSNIIDELQFDPPRPRRDDTVTLDQLLSFETSFAETPVVTAASGGGRERQGPSKSWKQDRWIVEPGCWTRIHDKPRRAMFTPLGTKDGPESGMLSASRVTLAEYVNPSASEVINDAWVVPDAHRLLKRKWIQMIPIYTY